VAPTLSSSSANALTPANRRRTPSAWRLPMRVAVVAVEVVDTEEAGLSPTTPFAARAGVIVAVASPVLCNRGDLDLDLDLDGDLDLDLDLDTDLDVEVDDLVMDSNREPWWRRYDRPAVSVARANRSMVSRVTRSATRARRDTSSSSADPTS